MNIYIFISIFIISIRLLIDIWTIFQIKETILWLSKDKLLDREPDIFFTIIIPLLHEQTLIVPLIDRMQQVVNCNDRIILVTTKAEISHGNVETTAIIVKKQLQGIANSPIIHFEASANCTCKGDQINEFILQDSLIMLGNTSHFIGIYDADSKPSSQSLKLVSLVAKHGARIVQQPSSYFLNYHNRSFLMRVRAASSTAFCFAFELTKFDKWPIATKPPAKWWRLSHLIGHGEFIRTDLLLKYYPLPTPSCDTSLGHRLSLSGENIWTVPALDYAEVPKTTTSMIKQNVNWYHGVSLLTSDIKWLLDKSIGSKYTEYIPMLFGRLILTIQWAIWPWLTLLSFVMFAWIIPSDWVWALLFLSYCAITSGPAIYIMLRGRHIVYNTDEIDHLFFEINRMFFFCWVVELLQSLGPWLFRLRQLVNTLTGVVTEKRYKTER